MKTTSYHDLGYPALALLYPEGGSNELRDEAWAQLTPLIYRKTTQAQLPHPDATAKALAFNPDASGVLLFGRSGTAKTRTAYLVARRAMDLAGSKHFTAITGRELRDRMTALSRTGGLTEWARGLVNDTDILLIDDIGHGNASDSYLSGVLELIEAATSDLVFVIITANFNGRELLAHWARTAPDARATAEAIVRRLGDFCTPVRFAPTTAPKPSVQ